MDAYTFNSRRSDMPNRLLVGCFFFVNLLLLDDFLMLDELDVVFPGHTISVASSVPGCICNFLHLKQSVRC